VGCLLHLQSKLSSRVKIDEKDAEGNKGSVREFRNFFLFLPELINTNSFKKREISLFQLLVHEKKWRQRKYGIFHQPSS
jgi:hypothetical protein